MSLGGIPEYLNGISKGSSAAQAIEKICFTPNGLLAGEFSNLYRSLFDKADHHIAVVRALASSPQGLTRQEIITACGLPTGGTTNYAVRRIG
ncbi:MAG TPA: hypothetical protein VG870_10200 [Chitinophagaceae bacterium]|nr:hypothetical protein [Chitinophagaceae bacterium]